MPGLTLRVLSGESVAAKRRTLVGEGLPIPAITTDGGAAAQARQAGAFAYLHRPFKLDVSVMAIHRGLESA